MDERKQNEGDLENAEPKFHVAKTLQEHPSLGYEEAYYLSKGKKVGESPGAQNLQMEREGDVFSNLSDMGTQNVNRNLEDEITMKGSRDRTVNQDSEVRVDNTHGVQAFRKACAAAASKVVDARQSM